MKTFKKLFVSLLLSMCTLVVAVGLTGCNTKEFVDYVKQTKIYSTNWKTSNFIQTGVGIVDYKTSVDGDTVHFECNGNLIKARFNGVDTPESTGILEKWGKQAANFTKDKVEAAKTIVLESEPLREDTSSPEQDSNGRYLVWIWLSDRTPEEEDGSELYLLNLSLIQEGFSYTKGADGSAYSDVVYDADLQAQKFNLHLYSDDKDPLFYEGDAEINELDVYQNTENYVGAKVHITGIITRTLGDNAYIQKTFVDCEGNEIGTYGLYIFTQYTKYDIFVKGNELAVTGTLAERYGSYQLINVTYSDIPALKSEDDMKLLSTGNIVEPIVVTASEANTKAYAGRLVTIENLYIKDGYGGYDNLYAECMEDPSTTEAYCLNSSNAMTLYAEQVVNGVTTQFTIRIDSSASIRNTNNRKIKDFNYFVGKTLTLTGIMGMYQSENATSPTNQLMLVATSDVTYVDM